MRLTIVRYDNMVSINGEPKPIDCSGLNTDISAVQWYGDHGHIEFVNDGADAYHFRLNEEITDISRFQPVIDAWYAYVPPPPPEPPVIEPPKTGDVPTPPTEAALRVMQQNEAARQEREALQAQQKVTR